MDARTGRIEMGLAGLPFGLHLDIPRLVAALFRSETTRLEFSVPPMSEEWLERHATESEKHVDRF